MARFSGLSPFEATSSIVAKAKMPAAAGQRPSHAGYASGSGSSVRADGPRDPRHRPADRPPRVERAEDVAEQDAQRHQREPEDHVDEDRREVRGGALRARAARVDGEPEQEDRRSRRRRSPPAGSPARGRCRRAAAARSGSCRRGSATAPRAPTNETTSTIAAAHPNSHLGHRQVRTDRDPVGDQEHGERHSGSTMSVADQRLAAGVLGHVALDLEIALDVGRELEGRRLARLDRPSRCRSRAGGCRRARRR